MATITYYDANRRMCLLVERTDTVVSCIPLDLDVGLRVVKRPVAEFDVTYKPLAGYTDKAAAVLFKQYACDIGASDDVLEYLGSITPIQQSEYKMSRTRMNARDNSGQELQSLINEVTNAPRRGRRSATPVIEARADDGIIEEANVVSEAPAPRRGRRNAQPPAPVVEEKFTKDEVVPVPARRGRRHAQPPVEVEESVPVIEEAEVEEVAPVPAPRRGRRHAQPPVVGESVPVIEEVEVEEVAPVPAPRRGRRNASPPVVEEKFIKDCGRNHASPPDEVEEKFTKDEVVPPPARRGRRHASPPVVEESVPVVEEAEVEVEEVAPVPAPRRGRRNALPPAPVGETASAPRRVTMDLEVKSDPGEYASIPQMLYALVMEGAKTDAEIFLEVQDEFNLDSSKRSQVAMARNELKQMGLNPPAPRRRRRPMDLEVKSDPGEYASVSQMFRALIMEGAKTDAEIFSEVQDEFGVDDDKRRYVAWYRGELKRKGLNPPNPVV